MTIDLSKIFASTDELSDGSHTFQELYYHRMLLTASLFNLLKNNTWKSLLHADGTMYEDYFIVGINTPEGQASYHYELKYWDLFDVKILDNAPEWDGHTPEESINRIYSYAKSVANDI